jgi:hypothetical protein
MPFTNPSLRPHQGPAPSPGHSDHYESYPTFHANPAGQNKEGDLPPLESQSEYDPDIAFRYDKSVQHHDASRAPNTTTQNRNQPVASFLEGSHRYDYIPPSIPTSSPPEVIWDYNEDEPVQETWREHREQNSPPSLRTSLQSSAGGSDARTSMRQFAAQVVRMDQKLIAIRSDQTYCVRLNRMLAEERQRMIREDVLGVRDKVEPNGTLTEGCQRTIREDVPGVQDNVESMTTTPPQFLRQNHSTPGVEANQEAEQEDSQRQDGTRVSSLQRTQTLRGVSSNRHATDQATVERHRSASQPEPMPHIGQALRVG